MKLHCDRSTCSFMSIIKRIIQHMKPRSSHQQATASNGDITPYIPLDVLETILFTLDVQTLFRCAFVCRDWNFFITSPYFMSRISYRTSESKSEIMLVKVCRYIESESVPESEINFHECYSLHWDNDQLDLFHTLTTPSIDGFKTDKVVGTSNGLVCLTDNSHEKFVLWNPTIKKYVMLPRLLLTWEVKRSNVGFGFDHRSNDFKVVKLVHRNFKLRMAYVFSYTTWSWKCHGKSACRPPRCRVFKKASPMFLNGILHWIAWNMDRGHQFVLTFDLTCEVFGRILLPERIAEIEGSCSIFTAGNSLALSKLVDGEGQIFRKWDVWVMKQYGVRKSWTNIVTSEEHLYDQLNRVLIPKHVLTIKKNGDIILEMRDGRILSYNAVTRRTNIVQGVTDLGVIKDRIFISYHKESLYLVEKSGNDCDPNIVFYSSLARPNPTPFIMNTTG